MTPVPPEISVLPLTDALMPETIETKKQNREKKPEGVTISGMQNIAVAFSKRKTVEIAGITLTLTVWKKQKKSSFPV